MSNMKSLWQLYNKASSESSIKRHHNAVMVKQYPEKEALLHGSPFDIDNSKDILNFLDENNGNSLALEFTILKVFAIYISKKARTLPIFLC